MAQEHQIEAQRAAGIREPKMHVCYVLRLGADEDGHGKYYIGSSQNFLNRMHNHIMGNERSAAWVRRWKFEELVETRHCHDRLRALPPPWFLPHRSVTVHSRSIQVPLPVRPFIYICVCVLYVAPDLTSIATASRC